jgi:1-acyl-sn-glycerol-3-phosphate acyltransferase
LAFRHPNGGEPPLLGWLIFFKLKRLAAKVGVKFAKAPHVIFIYGYEVVRWGGGAARLIIPNIGALPIHHSKIDKEGMSRIYDAIVDGPYPVALAPEGQVSYSTETIPRLEQGVIRIGFAAAERLAKSREDEGKEAIPLEILPVAIHFRFGAWGRLTLESLIRKMERYTGITGRDLTYHQRVKASRDLILKLNEKRYEIKTESDHSFEDKMDVIIEAALKTTEKILGVDSQGDVVSRMYHLRQICWDRMVLPGVNNFKSVCRIERNILDQRAGEAWHASRHLELVDLGWYLKNMTIPDDDAPLHNRIEYAQNVWDFANRTMGGAYNTRISIFPRRVIVKSAPALNLTEKLEDFRNDKKSAVNNALSCLMDSYEKCISEVNEVE